MQRHLKSVAFATLLALAAMSEGNAQKMGAKLERAAAVPLDFLAWINRDADWLTGALARAGVTSGVSMSMPQAFAEAETVEALKALNRIRAFAYLAGPGLRPPYFDIMLVDANGRSLRCLTQFPASVVPGAGPMDFDKETFPAADADPQIVDLCRVPVTKNVEEYERLDRVTFRNRYFDVAGHLKIEFANLNTAPRFIAAAIDHGFFISQGDYTGRLQLAAQ